MSSQYIWPWGASSGCEKLAHRGCALSKQADVCTLKDILNQQKTWVSTVFDDFEFSFLGRSAWREIA